LQFATQAQLLVLLQKDHGQPAFRPVVSLCRFSPPRIIYQGNSLSPSVLCGAGLLKSGKRRYSKYAKEKSNMAIVRILAAAAVTVAACSGAFAGPKPQQQGFTVNTATTGGANVGGAVAGGFDAGAYSSQYTQTHTQTGGNGATAGTSTGQTNQASAGFGFAAAGGATGAFSTSTTVQGK
jgi:hypothetical protein